MWRLHIVHHSDKNIDVTSGTRHHPIDFIIRESFTLFVVLVMGMPVSFYLFYRLITILFTYFNHANMKLPLKVDKAISLVIVSPNMFSIWDRIFGTFVYGDPEKIQSGLDCSDHTEDENIKVQLAIPFDKNVKSLDR